MQSRPAHSCLVRIGIKVDDRWRYNWTVSTLYQPMLCSWIHNPQRGTQTSNPAQGLIANLLRIDTPKKIQWLHQPILCWWSRPRGIQRPWDSSCNRWRLLAPHRPRPMLADELMLSISRLMPLIPALRPANWPGTDSILPSSSFGGLSTEYG